MRGGVINKVNGIWKIKKPSGRPLVNMYRDLEVIVLEEFLKNGHQEDSNDALQREGGVLMGNFREACNRALQSPDDSELFKKLETCVENVDEIIRLRKQEMVERRPATEADEDIERRKRHETRMGYWEFIQPSLTGLLETTRVQIQDALARREADVRRRAVEDVFRSEQEQLGSVASAFDFKPFVPVEPVSPELIERYRQEQQQRQTILDDMSRQRAEAQRAEAISRQQQEEEAARLAKQDRAERARTRDLAVHELAKQAKAAREEAEREFNIYISEQIQKAKDEKKPAEAARLLKVKSEKIKETPPANSSEEETQNKKFIRFAELMAKILAENKEGKEESDRHAVLAKILTETQPEYLRLKDQGRDLEPDEFKKVRDVFKKHLDKAQNDAEKKLINDELEKLKVVEMKVTVYKKRLARHSELAKTLPAKETALVELAKDLIELRKNLYNDTFKLCDNVGCYKKGSYPCGYCKAVHYCGKVCQTVDWNFRHKGECSGKYRPQKGKGGTKRNVKTRRKTRKYK